MSGFEAEIAVPVVSHVDWAPRVRTYLFQPCDEALPFEIEGVRAPDRPGAPTLSPERREDAERRP